MGIFFSASKPDDVVVLLGPVGTNKTTFVNTAAWHQLRGDRSLVDRSLPVGKPGGGRCTTEVQLVQAEAPPYNRRVVLVDTPGFDDTLTIPDIVTMVNKHLYNTYPNLNYRIAGILYFHPITQSELVIDPLNYLDSFERLCGPNPAPRIVLVTTPWWDEDICRLREADYNEPIVKKSWAKMREQGSAIRRFEGSIASAWEIIGLLPAQC